MGIKIHTDVYQGTAEWLALRLGILTASEMDEIVTPGTMKPAKNDKVRKHLFNLMAQRITKYADPGYQSFDMMRGQAEEIDARDTYSANYAPVDQVGFISNDKWGFEIGFSPDGLVGEDGLIECKSRAPKFQMETIMNDNVPAEYMVQIQVGMMVSERKWCDFISYSNGLPMFTKRVMADEGVQSNILAAAAEFYNTLDDMMIKFAEQLKNNPMRLIATERKDYGDIIR